MSQKRIKISSRTLMELLAGRLTIEKINELHNGGPKSPHKQSQMVIQFARHLDEGRLPNAITVLKTDQNDSDDWIEFAFDDPDPAISLLR